MRFPFSLQPLLDWKRNLEEVARIRLTAKLTLLRAQEEEIERLIRKRTKQEEELREKLSRGIAAAEYVLYRQDAEEKRLELRARQEKKQESLRELEKDREKIGQLSKEKKTLERLKEKKRKAFFDRAEKNEQKRTDEMVVTRRRI